MFPEVVVSELDQAWAMVLAEAEARARAAGRTDISEYIALRRSNDLLRKTAGDWLVGLFAVAAGHANRAGAAIKISTEDAHRFKVGNAGMVGSRLSLESGVRMVIVEVGWPREPRDGFIRGGGLACANIKHRGIKSANEELRLILSASGTPQWIGKARPGRPHGAYEFHEANVKDHIAMLLDVSRNPSKRS